MAIENEQLQQNQEGTDDGAKGSQAAAPAPEAITPETEEAAFRKGLGDEGEQQQQTTDLNGGKPVTDDKDGGDADAPAPAPAADDKAGDKDKPGEQQDDEAAKKAKADAEAEAAIAKEADTLGVKDKARQRFTELATGNRELTQKVESLTSERDSLKELADANDGVATMLLESGMNEDQLGSMLQIGTMMNGSLDDRKQAYQGMCEALVMMSNDLGLPLPTGGDPLEGHPDLKQLVEDGDMSAEAAQKVVESRVQQRFNDTQQQSSQEQQQLRQAQEQGFSDLQGFASEHQNDPGYQQKTAMLKPTLDLIVNTKHPSEWKDAVARAYRDLPDFQGAPAPAPARGPAPAPARPPVSHRPMTTGQGAPGGGMERQPQNETEAFLRGARIDMPS